MTKGRKVKMLIAIDRIKGELRLDKEGEVQVVYYWGLLEALHEGARHIPGTTSVNLSIMEEYFRLVKLFGNDGGFKYGKINGESKKAKKIKQVETSMVWRG